MNSPLCEACKGDLSEAGKGGPGEVRRASEESHESEESHKSVAPPRWTKKGREVHKAMLKLWNSEHPNDAVSSDEPLALARRLFAKTPFRDDADGQEDRTRLLRYMCETAATPDNKGATMAYLLKRLVHDPFDVVAFHDVLCGEFDGRSASGCGFAQFERELPISATNKEDTKHRAEKPNRPGKRWAHSKSHLEGKPGSGATPTWTKKGKEVYRSILEHWNLCHSSDNSSNVESLARRLFSKTRVCDRFRDQTAMLQHMCEGAAKPGDEGTTLSCLLHLLVAEPFDLEQFYSHVDEEDKKGVSELGPDQLKKILNAMKNVGSDDPVDKSSQHCELSWDGPEVVRHPKCSESGLEMYKRLLKRWNNRNPNDQIKNVAHLVAHLFRDLPISADPMLAFETICDRASEHGRGCDTFVLLEGIIDGLYSKEDIAHQFQHVGEPYAKMLQDDSFRLKLQDQMVHAFKNFEDGQPAPTHMEFLFNVAKANNVSSSELAGSDVQDAMGVIIKDLVEKGGSEGLSSLVDELAMDMDGNARDEFEHLKAHLQSETSDKCDSSHTRHAPETETDVTKDRSSSDKDNTDKSSGKGKAALVRRREPVKTSQLHGFFKKSSKVARTTPAPPGNVKRRTPSKRQEVEASMSRCPAEPQDLPANNQQVEATRCPAESQATTVASKKKSKSRKKKASRTVLYACTNLACGKQETKRREFKRCGRCPARYCSSECSCADWKRHKKECKKNT